MLRAAEHVVRTDPGRQRSGNEDATYARSPVFALADGMGGAQSGEVASAIVADTFAQGVPDDGTAEERLVAVIQQANRKIHDRQLAEHEHAGMGTTVTAAYLDEDAVAVANVGDSRAYLFRDGELVRLTTDHSLVEELVRKGTLTEEEAFEHPQRSIITRALGAEHEVQVDTWSYPLQAGDVVMLCSDGLTDMITEREVQQVLVEAPSLDVAADRLIDAANAAGGRDNITVVLFRAQEVDALALVDQPTEVHPIEFDEDGGPENVGPASGSVAKAAAAGAEVPVVPPPAFRAPMARLQGLRPRVPAGWTQPASQQRSFGRTGKLVAGLVSTLVVVFLVGAGGYIASRQLYFLGTNGQGTVVVYRGFPYVLPFGIPMYETFYVSGVPASTIAPTVRGNVLNHAMRDQTSAIKLVNSLELGKIQG
jgi:serine/threonine protein phosphatase PrpC